jgi:hypothetical protein
MERYWITGVQLGILKFRAKQGDKKEINKLIEEIIDDQFIGNNPENSIKIEDMFKVKDLSKMRKREIHERK